MLDNDSMASRQNIMLFFLVWVSHLRSLSLANAIELASLDNGTGINGRLGDIPKFPPADISTANTLPSRGSPRNGRFLNLLRMVKFRFQPKPCTGSTVGSSGRCLTQFECKQTEGRADGTCASGFGVCCIQEAKCGSVVQYNDTYLVNDGYPMKTSSVMNCVYNIRKINDNICQLRLDFETLVLAGPNDQSICREDKLNVLSPAEGPSVIICGTNSGKHMYVEMGRGQGSARVSIGLTSSNLDRGWRIRVSQIACSSPFRAPENCLQYYTDYTATIESFNFKNIDGVHQIGGLQYTICIRAKEGVCGIRYKSNTFSVSGNGAPLAGPSALSGDTSCIKDFLMIPSLSQPPSTATSPDRYCGTSFAERSTYSKPFQIRLVTDENETGDTANRGFSLTYTQIPC